MLIWMTGIVSMATALCAAAWLAEKAARAIRAPTRWIWALAILGSLLLPAATRCLSAEWSSLSALIPARIAAPTGNSGQLKLRQLSQSLGGASVANKWKQYDALLSYAWIAMTLGSSVVLIISHATWLRRRRIWTRGTLNQSAVYFAANFGPAVMGFIRPSIIVPVWLKHSPPAQQALVLAHESSHIDAHDPQLLTAALALVVAMPWNVPLWWQLLRLRRAVEIDCDARVLAGGHDAARYGETLLEVGQRQSRIIGTAIAMSESPSFLEERIAIMIGKPAQSARIAAIGFTGLAMVLAAVATQIAPANGLPPIAATAGVGPEVLVKLTQSALDGFAGYYKGSEISVMVVAREEDHLILQSSGEAKGDAVYPESATRFFYANPGTDARIQFEIDAQGQPTSAVLLQNGGSLRMPRIDVTAAQQIKTMRSLKLQSRTPSAGSAAALRHFIEGILSGRPDLDKLGPPLAGQVAKDFAKLQLTLAPLGGLKSLAFRSVDRGAFDVYEATHEHGASEWRIDVDNQGTITGAMFPVVVAQ